MTICPKCGLQGLAFICSTPGCPVNGGADYGWVEPEAVEAVEPCIIPPGEPLTLP
jgi:hypothetical protein